MVTPPRQCGCSVVYGIARTRLEIVGWGQTAKYCRNIAIADEEPMPGKHHVRGVNAKEQREYEHIKESAERSGRYGDRAKEVAARTVLKKHKAEAHSKGH
jgi:hypothetical protein